MIVRIGESRTTTVMMSTGADLEVAGSPQDVAKRLQDAFRSSPGTLAWLDDAEHGTAIGVNPAHVVALLPVAVQP